MNFTQCKPTPSLAPWIEMYWLCEGYHPRHDMEFKLPDASLSLIINLKEDRIRIYPDKLRTDRYELLPGSIIAGPQSSYYLLDTACQASCIGVLFKPGGAYPFLGRLVGELRDLDVSLGEGLALSYVDQLRYRLLETPGADQRFHILEQSLLQWLKEMTVIPQGHPAVRYALHMLEEARIMPSIAAMAETANLSTEQFIRVFREEVGLTPKLYGRIIRFQSLLRMLQQERELSGIELALESGYFDQSHMNKDFRNFSGMTPTEYVNHHKIFGNHVAI